MKEDWVLDARHISKGIHSFQKGCQFCSEFVGHTSYFSIKEDLQNISTNEQLNLEDSWRNAWLKKITIQSYPIIIFGTKISKNVKINKTPNKPLPINIENSLFKKNI